MRKVWLVLLCLVLAAAPAAAQGVRDSLPVPDVPGYKTLKCDFHMHTVFSDGDVWPTLRVTEAFRDGLDAIAITDHAAYNPKKDDVRYDLNRPYALARDLAAQLGLILVHGIEVNDGLTHVNAIFLKDAQALVGVGLKEVLVRAKQQGAFAFWNHPGWRRTPDWSYVADFHKDGLFAGMEIVNGRDFYPEAYPWIEQYKLAILADSDIHRPIGYEYGKRERPVTLAFVRTRDEAGLKEALVERRTAAWMNGQVWGFEPHLSALWSGAVKAEGTQLASKPGGRVVLMLRNDSALPFEINLAGSPQWLKGGSASLPPQAATGLALAVDKTAPAGAHRVELEFEVANFYIGPGRNLRVKLPLTVTVAR